MTCGGDLRQPPPEEPTTPEEWQLVVDAAAGFRCIAECRMYGLMKGGPEIDVQNCAGLKSTCRTVSTSWRAAPSWATLPPHQLALAMISVWNAEVADPKRPPQVRQGYRSTLRRGRLPPEDPRR